MHVNYFKAFYTRRLYKYDSKNFPAISVQINIVSVILKKIFSFFLQ